jgi:hypothetical protein
MIHANLVDSGAFFGVAALTLLLMMFLYAVVTADPEEATRTETPLMPSPVLPPAPVPVRGTPAPLPVREAPAPLPVREAPAPLPVREAPAPLPVRGAAFAPPAFPAGTGRPGGSDYAPTHRAGASVAPPLEVSSGPQRKPAAALLFLLAGLALAVIGGGLFFRTGQDVTVCAHQALAICSDGFVVLHATQLLGGALAVGGIGLVSTAIVLALR